MHRLWWLMRSSMRPIQWSAYQLTLIDKIHFAIFFFAQIRIEMKMERPPSLPPPPPLSSLMQTHTHTRTAGGVRTHSCKICAISFFPTRIEVTFLKPF